MKGFMIGTNDDRPWIQNIEERRTDGGVMIELFFWICMGLFIWAVCWWLREDERPKTEIKINLKGDKDG